MPDDIEDRHLHAPDCLFERFAGQNLGASIRQEFPKCGFAGSGDAGANLCGSESGPVVHDLTIRF